MDDTDDTALRIDRMVLAMFGTTATFCSERPESDADLEILPRLIMDGYIAMLPRSYYREWTFDFEITHAGHDARMRHLRRLARKAEALVRRAEAAYAAHEFMTSIPEPTAMLIDEPAPIANYELNDEIAHEPATAAEVQPPLNTRAQRAMTRHMCQLVLSWQCCQNEEDIAAFVVDNGDVLRNLSTHQRNVIRSIENGGEFLEAVETLVRPVLSPDASLH